jgi:hypothetical protein
MLNFKRIKTSDKIYCTHHRNIHNFPVTFSFVHANLCSIQAAHVLTYEFQMMVQDLNPVTWMLHHPEITMELQLDNTGQADQVEHVTKYTHNIRVVVSSNTEVPTRCTCYRVYFI